MHKNHQLLSYMYLYCSLKHNLPSFGSSTIARDSKCTPLSRMICPPSWKPFSITIPHPIRLAPEPLTRSINPFNAWPLARKSSMIRILSSGGQKLLFYENIKFQSFCIRNYLRGQQVSVQIFGHGFLCKYNRDIVKILCCNRRDSNP